jgi:hypothetical protein
VGGPDGTSPKRAAILERTCKVPGRPASRRRPGGSLLSRIASSPRRAAAREAWGVGSQKSISVVGPSEGYLRSRSG